MWRDQAFAEHVQRWLKGEPAPTPTVKPEPKLAAPEKKELRRSEALSLLAVLQRDARFVDFIKEPMSAYSDAQIGAAVRDVHQGCAAVLERLFALQPLNSTVEGQTIEVPRGFDPAQYRLTGQVPNEPPYRGRLCHPGWKATKCEVPQWTGNEASALVVAPAEVEIK